MENEDDHMNQRILVRKRFFERFLPEQTIVYMQYCLLRIPFLLLYDYLFSNQFHHLIESLFQYSIDILKQQDEFLFKPITYVLQSYFFQLLVHLNLILSIPVLSFILLIGLLLCSDRRLVIFYSYSISFFLIYFYYQINHLADIQYHMFFLQFILSLIYIQMLNMRTYVHSHYLQERFCYFAPFVYLLTRYLFPMKFSLMILNLYYLVWISTHLAELIIYRRHRILRSIRYELLNNLIRFYENFGIQTLIDCLHQDIRLVVLLRIFWLTKIILLPLGLRTIYTHPYLMHNHNQTNFNETTLNNYNETLTKTIYFTVIFYGTETIFTLISLACLIGYGMKKLSNRLFRFLHIWTENVEQIGTVIGVMFFLLLFQWNITQLDLHRRHIPLLKALCLILVALFHFLHTILEPQLLQVAMQTMTTNIAFEQIERNRSFSRIVLHSFHHRHVYTCLFLLILLSFYIILLWNVTHISTWLLAITAFLIELIVRLLASLGQYTLHILDAHRCLTNADLFDEYIFRIKAMTGIFEFILGVFLLGNGIYIFCYEARGALRAFILAIHAYMNIVKNFRRGWEILRNRRSAWDNVKKLPLANEEQINEYNDICSICHESLTIGNTCITPCVHFFHQKCLQKVFYATLNCALCSRTIIRNGQIHQQ